MIEHIHGGNDSTSDCAGCRAEYSRVPRRIRHVAECISKGTGIRVMITHGTAGRWILRAPGERIQLEARYKQRGTPLGADITVDGESWDFPHDCCDFVEIYTHPEIVYRDPVLEPFPELDSTLSRAVPVDIMRFLNIIERKGMTGYRFARTSESACMVGLDLPGDSGLRMFFTRQPRGWWDLDRLRPMHVVHHGKDISPECNGQLEKALARLAPAIAEQPGTAGESGVSAAPAAASNAVRERRHAVDRQLCCAAGRACGTLVAGKGDVKCSLSSW